MKKTRLIYHYGEQLEEKAITKASNMEANNKRKLANVMDDRSSLC